MRGRWKRHLKRICLAMTGLMCGTTCAFFVMAEEPLKNLIIADGVAEVAKYEYCDKTFLESVYVPGSVQKIGVSAFDGCSTLQNVQLQEGISVIDNRGFALCSRISQIALPNSVVRLGNASFYGCSALRDVRLPANLTMIENNLFYQCVSLSNIVIPQSVTSIGQQSFFHCTSLTNITLPERVTSIGEGAFHNCSNLRSINIPDSVNYIGNAAFAGCNQLVITCNPGSYAEQYARAAGLQVNTGQAAIVIADQAASQTASHASGKDVVTSQNKQTVVIPKTGVERPYVLCISAIILAFMTLSIMNRRQRELN